MFLPNFRTSQMQSQDDDGSSQGLGKWMATGATMKNAF